MYRGECQFCIEAYDEGSMIRITLKSLLEVVLIESYKTFAHNAVNEARMS